MPIRLSAASWDIDTDETVDPRFAADQVEQWLTVHLVDTYHLSAGSAQALVTARRRCCWSSMGGTKWWPPGDTPVDPFIVNTG